MARRLQAEVCVGAVVFREDRLLLLRRADTQSFAPGEWDIPGGHVEAGERLEAALLREVREETGFSVRVGPPIFAQTYRYRIGAGRWVPTVEVDYLCALRSTRPPVLDPAEHTEFRWARRGDLRRHRLPALLRGVVSAAFAARTLPTPRLRRTPGSEVASGRTNPDPLLLARRTERRPRD